ncbi:MAG TPA: glycosyltransferase family A protein [Terriglobales bacterium]|jgi:biofilm PGA synthesis N-glycosyltransferase PgaC|nr:glycosyltransferase family A protein [Terriglobales bacterium]
MLSRYVLITPARNEARFIELTLASVVAQTVCPVRWVIVSDGSTDGTDEIVARYAAQYSWIELVRMPERRERDFAGKVHAFNAGYVRVQNLEWEVIASLDGDISFDPDYFAFLLSKLQSDPVLGLVGTPFQELSGESYDYRFVNIEHVSGACQVFRRECFTAIGGYLPVKGGSIDHIAVLTARLKRWKTRTFAEKVCIHHREMGTAQQSIVRSRFLYGAKDYRMGNHPVWEIFRTVHQMRKRPWLVGGMALGSGYLWAWLRGMERPVSDELMVFHRQEQMQRLKGFLGGKRKAAEGKQPSTPVRGAL